MHIECPERQPVTIGYIAPFWSDNRVVSTDSANCIAAVEKWGARTSGQVGVL